MKGRENVGSLPKDIFLADMFTSYQVEQKKLSLVLRVMAQNHFHL